MMHICLICNESLPHDHGGIGSLTKDLAEGLVYYGYQVTVFGIYHKLDTWLKEELKPAKWSLLKSIIRDPFKNNIQKFIIDEEGISVIKY